jgi:hypothetical protein
MNPPEIKIAKMACRQPQVAAHHLNLFRVVNPEKLAPVASGAKARK